MKSNDYKITHTSYYIVDESQRIIGKRIARNFFRFLGVVPLVAPIGKVAKSEAEIAGGKRYLSDIQAYAPLLKVSAINASIRQQAEKIFVKNVDLYNKFEKITNFVTLTKNEKIPNVGT